MTDLEPKSRVGRYAREAALTWGLHDAEKRAARGLRTPLTARAGFGAPSTHPGAVCQPRSAEGSPRTHAGARSVVSAGPHEVRQARRAPLSKRPERLTINQARAPDRESEDRGLGEVLGSGREGQTSAAPTARSGAPELPGRCKLAPLDQGASSRRVPKAAPLWRGGSWRPGVGAFLGKLALGRTRRAPGGRARRRGAAFCAQAAGSSAHHPDRERWRVPSSGRTGRALPLHPRPGRTPRRLELEPGPGLRGAHRPPQGRPGPPPLCTGRVGRRGQLRMLLPPPAPRLRGRPGGCS